MKLLHKLHQHGARGNTLSWIKAFLTGRSQTVVLEGESSSEIPVNSGVPQGSVIGPLLFLLHINDLPENIHSQVRLFADDTAIYITVNNHSDSDILQQDLDTLQTWECLWDMDFNPSKCQVLHISKSRHPAQHIYMLHGQALEAMDHAKYLGVNISKDLSWNTHINRISTNANRTLGFLKRNIKTKNTTIRTAAYQTLVRPQIEYTSTVWSPFTQTYINKIEMVQRRAVRWVNSNTYASVSSMLDSLGWRSLEDRRADARPILFYKIVYNLVAVPLPQYINHPVRMTRHMHPLQLQPVTTNIRSFRWPLFSWFDFPHHIPVLSDLDSFRSAVRTVSHFMP